MILYLNQCLKIFLSSCTKKHLLAVVGEWITLCISSVFILDWHALS